MWNLTISIRWSAVISALFVGIAVAVSSLTIVRAERAHITHDNQVYTCSAQPSCVEGAASGKNVFGVWGKSSGGTGVQGDSTATNKNSGVAGVNTATSGTGYGVYGRSSNGPGVYGTSSVRNGIEGHASYPGVAGVAGYGSSFGLYGSATEGAGMYAESTAYEGYAILISANSVHTNIFAGENSNTGGNCVIDPDANLTCSGTIQGGADVSMRHRTSEGRHVLAYASQSATETIEDVGTARMSDGVANVRIDPAFVSVMDHRWYYIFLTPMGDTRGLYVSMKTASGFQVRENEHGRSNVEFDYRIVAHPFDAKYERLPDAPMMPKPHIAIPQMPRP
jgi:hypothetical protein